MRIEPSWSIGIALTLALIAGSSAFAGDGDRRGNNREDMREQRQAQRQERLRDVRAMQSLPPQYQPQPQYQESPQYQPQQAQPPSDNGRRGGRMSPEERRALRRQIDQASHDMYGPGR